MGYIALAGLFISALFSLLSPWIGVVSGYICILLGPQVLWWWAFGGARHFLVIAACTGIGVLQAWVKGNADTSLVNTRQNKYLFIWFCFITLSFFAGPYIDGGPGERYFPPAYIFEIMIKAFVFYFLAVISIDSHKKFKLLSVVIVLVGIYYCYWINNRYLTGYYGRLGGPRGLNIDQYGDQNDFAMFFVISLPFIYYYGTVIESKIIKYIVWLFIPFGWHGIFLTGSRGGFLGLCVTTFVMLIRSPKKIYGFLLMIALLLAFLFQGGPIMKERSATIGISAAQHDTSVKGRLDSWKAAAKMISKHPLTGVGIASFGMAYPDFSDADPREAHNTFFQIGAESGIFAVLAYMLFIFSTIKGLWRTLPSKETEVDKVSSRVFLYRQAMHEATLIAWIGFAVCACFLSLQVFEQFFYLAVLSNFLINSKSKCYV